MGDAPTEWDFLQGNFEADGSPVESDDVGSFDDAIVDQGFRNESELASAYAAANDDAAAVGRTQSLLDQQNLADLELQEQLAEDALFEGSGYDEGIPFPQAPPANPQLEAALDQFQRDDPAGYAALSRAVGVEPPPQLTPQQQLTQSLAESTTASLAALADVERSRSEREQMHEAQAESAFAQDVVEAYGRAQEIAHPLLEKFDASHADMATVLNDADAILEASGFTSEVIAQMDEWSSEQLAKEAIAQAAERAGHAAITRNVLREYGGRRR